MPRCTALRSALKAPPPTSSRILPGLDAPGANGAGDLAAPVDMGAADGKQFWALHAGVILRRSRRDDRRASASRQRGPANRRRLPCQRACAAAANTDFKGMRPKAARRNKNGTNSDFSLQDNDLDCSCNFGTKRVHISQRHRIAGFIDDEGVLYHGSERVAAYRGKDGGQIEGAGRRACADRARLRQGLDHAARRQRAGGRDRDRADRLARARHRARRRRPAARPHRRDLRAGKLGQDDAGAAHGRRGAEEGRHLRLRRCRARARPGLCPQARRRPREPA